MNSAKYFFFNSVLDIFLYYKEIKRERFSFQGNYFPLESFVQNGGVILFFLYIKSAERDNTTYIYRDNLATKWSFSYFRNTIFANKWWKDTVSLCRKFLFTKLFFKLNSFKVLVYVLMQEKKIFVYTLRGKYEINIYTVWYEYRSCKILGSK